MQYFLVEIHQKLTSGVSKINKFNNTEKLFNFVVNFDFGREKCVSIYTDTESLLILPKVCSLKHRQITSKFN